MPARFLEGFFFGLPDGALFVDVAMRFFGGVVTDDCAGITEEVPVIDLALPMLVGETGAGSATLIESFVASKSEPSRRRKRA
jgi:hypothetical protein